MADLNSNVCNFKIKSSFKLSVLNWTLSVALVGWVTWCLWCDRPSAHYLFGYTLLWSSCSCMNSDKLLLSNIRSPCRYRSERSYIFWEVDTRDDTDTHKKKYDLMVISKQTITGRIVITVIHNIGGITILKVMLITLNWHVLFNPYLFGILNDMA